MGRRLRKVAPPLQLPRQKLGRHGELRDTPATAELRSAGQTGRLSLRGYRVKYVARFPRKTKPPMTGRLSGMLDSARNLLLRGFCFGGFGFAGIALGVLAAEAFYSAGGIH